MCSAEQLASSSSTLRNGNHSPNKVSLRSRLRRASSDVRLCLLIARSSHESHRHAAHRCHYRELLCPLQHSTQPHSGSALHCTGLPLKAPPPPPQQNRATDLSSPPWNTERSEQEQGGQLCSDLVLKAFRSESIQLKSLPPQTFLPHRCGQRRKIITAGEVQPWLTLTAH